MYLTTPKNKAFLSVQLGYFSGIKGATLLLLGRGSERSVSRGVK